MTLVDYGLLAKSTEFYEDAGYKRVEAPWLVSEKISDLTRPDFAAQYVVHKEHGNSDNDGKRKAFVASGEQSFLYMMSKGFLAQGMYQTITPCIRNEAFDETHVKYFMKNELIIVGDAVHRDPRDAVATVGADALKFFTRAVFPHGDLIKMVQTDIGWDIELDGVEIGSYGYRESMIGNWVYGTGLAEPRFSRVLNNLRRRNGLPPS